MSMKNLDTKGRLRSKIVSFRVSPEESAKIDEMVKLSGLTKQDYIISKVTNREVVVKKNARTAKALQEHMLSILNELRRIKSADECSEDFLDTIRIVSKVYDGMQNDR